MNYGLKYNVESEWLCVLSFMQMEWVGNLANDVQSLCG